MQQIEFGDASKLLCLYDSTEMLCEGGDTNFTGILYKGGRIAAVVAIPAMPTIHQKSPTQRLPAS